MNSIHELIKAKPDEISPEFKDEFPSGITGALKIMQVGHYYYWDCEDASYRSFHSIAHNLGIKIRTKKCKIVSCFVVQRIA